MGDCCMYNQFSQCFHDCENCPRADTPEPDWDLLYELEKEEKDA